MWDPESHNVQHASTTWQTIAADSDSIHLITTRPPGLTPPSQEAQKAEQVTERYAQKAVM